MRREAQAEAATAVDWRAIETEAVRDLLAGDGRRVFEIPPDGHW